MPQLRDSTHSLEEPTSNELVGSRDITGINDGASDVNASTVDDTDSANDDNELSNRAHGLPFERIFGIETEYGVSVTGQRPDSDMLDASHVASVIFEPIVSQSRSTNTYIENGSRLYLDVGAHPEYATAEARTVTDAVRLDAAGENLMAALAHQAERALRERTGNEKLRVHMYKNNTDSQGNSFGCHENYLVRRHVRLNDLEQSFIPFLVTRQIFAGTGVIRAGQFQISQRADFLEDTISSATTRARPMINTRDEPHADSRMYRRLHVIVGDSNRSQKASWMKMMCAHLVLCMIEAQARGEDYRLTRFAMQKPGECARSISRDTSLSAQMTLISGMQVTAIDIQQGYCDAAGRFIARHYNDLAQDMRNDMIACVELWHQTLESLRQGNFSELSSWVDWVAKYQLIQSIKKRSENTQKLNANDATQGTSEGDGETSSTSSANNSQVNKSQTDESQTIKSQTGKSAVDARISQIDFAYHDIAHDDVIGALQKNGKITPIFTLTEIRAARHNPPSDTRAWLRGNFIQQARKNSVQWSADWTSITMLGNRERQAMTVHLIDPFEHSPNEEYDEFMGEILTSRKDDPMLPLI
ncbi:Pup--protein ligase [Alloscardovia theropitheci]|uniref:Pup--protein ligase n=1 Tax=Alloscardovia theropitheci TaxID=2496842 RepID=A0A4R0QRB5_9BIFI|nr:proteasome accessory factor PafA2 family protein [Alloscardovia theropitheci]TCD54902.1 Pup--protein ligase [Alloscardovia theropitheci]